MRYFLAIAVLLCGAASAFAVTAPTKWCSGDFDKDKMVISADGKTVTINGQPLAAKRVLFAKVEPRNGAIPQRIAIVGDQVFWPCP